LGRVELSRIQPFDDQLWWGRGRRLRGSITFNKLGSFVEEVEAHVLTNLYGISMKV
jgi:hypothetical protein